MSRKLASYFPLLGAQRTPARADQRQNAAGGYVFGLDPFARLARFLVLGVDGGTYYASERALTVESAACVRACLDLDAARTVSVIVATSESGRAPKNDAAIFALAVAAGHPSPKARSLALAALPRVCRTASHLFTFVDAVRRFRRWGRSLRRAIARWYLDAPVDRLVYQVLKYPQRGGLSHRDLLRLAHPAPQDDLRHAVFGWVTAGGAVPSSMDVEPQVPPARGRPAHAALLPPAIPAYEALQQTHDDDEILMTLRTYRFTHEMVPSRAKRSPRVAEALAESMPIAALVRGLGQLGSVGVLAPGSAAEALVVARLSDARALRAARLHPLAVLAARLVYASGRGVRGKLTWAPSPAVVAALDAAFARAFSFVEASGKRFLLALDVSGSMGAGVVGGLPGLTPRLASATMAMATLRTEPACSVVGFSHQLVDIPLRARDSLDAAVAKVSAIPMGATDCALPMLHAAKTKTPVDVFVVYTDNETWYGNVHPYEALRRYRAATGIPAKLAVVGMTATEFTIADPKDPGTMDFVGFDAAAPAILADFARA